MAFPLANSLARLQDQAIPYKSYKKQYYQCSNANNTPVGKSLFQIR